MKHAKIIIAAIVLAARVNTSATEEEGKADGN